MYTNVLLQLLRYPCFKSNINISVSKTKYLRFDLVASFILPEDVVNHILNCAMTNFRCNEIEMVNNFIYLEGVLDANLNWQSYISILHNKLNSLSKCFIIRKTFAIPVY